MIMAVLECKKILHYPRLDTVIKIEDFIKNHDGKYTRTELWGKLEKKMMYQTYKIIIDYLVKSNKVIMKDYKLVWIFNPELKEKLMKSSVEV